MRIVSALTLVLVVALPAMAQNDSVTVNGDGTGQTLIDPATGQSRYVPALLQPWQDDAIRLRPPGHHRAKPRTSAPTTATLTPTATAEPAPAPAPKKKRMAAAAPPPAPAATPAAAPKPAKSVPSSSFSGFADIDLITGTGQQAAPKATAPSLAPAQPKPAAVTPKPTRTASIQLPKSKTPTGTRKDSISFTPGASDPSGSAVASVRGLANALSSAMGESGRVQLMAYAGGKGEKTSDTRRLSLKRALVIRQLLIDDGIPSERIDVFALGGVDDDGALDRVDVFVKS